MSKMEMTKDEIIEGNILIAKFMNLKNEISDLYYVPEFGYYFNSYGYIEYNEMFSSNNLKYSSSWDWIMTVVEKIIKTPNPLKGNDTTKFTLQREVQAYVSRVDIRNTFKEIIKFIKWYNERKQ